MKADIRNLLFLTFFVLSSTVLHAQTTIVYSQNESRSPHSKSVIKTNKGKSTFDLEYDGEFTISDDDKDISDVSRGGYFELTKTAFGTKRKVRIERDGSGLSREFYIGRDKQPYEPEGREWLAEVLPELLRSTTIGAESRVNRFYRKGGADAVIKEIALLESDYVTQEYLKLLFKKDLNTAEQKRIIAIIGNISSDYYQSELLKAYQSRYGLNQNTLTEFLTAAQGISSDYYQFQIVNALIDNPNITDSQATILLDNIDKLGSDYYKMSALKKYIESRKLNEAQTNRIMESCGDISSDYYLSELVNLFLKSQDSQFSNFTSIMKLTSKISSDYYVSNIFSELLNKQLDDATLQMLLQQAGSRISSDLYLSQIIEKTLKTQKLSPGNFQAIINSVGEISSDLYVRNIIKSTIKMNINESQLIQVLNLSGNEISSDFYLSETLVELAPKVNQVGGKARDTYMQVAKKISSDTYYGKAMKAIN